MSIVKRNNYVPSTSLFDDLFTRDLFDWSTEGSSLPRVPVLTL